MTALVVLLQILLPVGLLVWLARFPAASVASYLLRAAGIGLFLLALAVVAIWIVPPWWVPLLYGAIWVGVVAFHFARRRLSGVPLWPAGRSGWVGAALSVVLIAVGAWGSGVALAGRALPPVEVIDIPNPLGPGRYLVAHGGPRELVNGHMKTLDPTVERFRTWRGQSYAVDLVGIDALGLRADGWRPENPARYAIFGAPVHAPCAGTVAAAQDAHPDMPVPVMDSTNMLGNHVILRCGEAELVFAHFREGSVAVEAGQRVDPGTPLGQVGNSGNSSEPHLHLHTQRPGRAEAPIAAEPLALRIDGRFLVRNERIAGREW